MRAKVLQIVWHDKLPVFSVDFHPTNGKFATAGGDNFVRVWRFNEENKTIDNTPQVELLASLNRHTKAVNVVRFSPNGEMLATAGDDGTVIIWKYNGPVNTATSTKQKSQSLADDDMEDRETWCISGFLRSHVEDIYDLAWSPDSTMLMTGSIDNVVRLWDARQFKLLRDIRDHTHYVQGVAWDPRGRFIASQSADRSVRIFELRWKKREELAATCVARHQSLDHDADPGPPATEPSSLDQNPPNSDDDPVKKAGNPENPSHKRPRQKLYINEHLPSFFRRLSFSLDGSLLVTPAGQYKTTPLSITDNKEQAVPSSSSSSSTVYLYTRRDLSRPALCLDGFPKPVLAVRFCPRVFQLVNENSCVSLFQLPYRLIYAVLTLDSLYLFDTQHTTPLASLQQIHYAPLTDMSWRADGCQLLISSMDGFLTVVDWEKEMLGVVWQASPFTVPSELTRPLLKKEKGTDELLLEVPTVVVTVEDDMSKKNHRRIQPILISTTNE